MTNTPQPELTSTGTDAGALAGLRLDALRRPAWWSALPLLPGLLYFAFNPILGAAALGLGLVAMVALRQATRASLALWPAGLQWHSPLGGTITARWDEISDCAWDGRVARLVVNGRALRFDSRWRPWPRTGELLAAAVAAGRTLRASAPWAPAEVAQQIGLRPDEVVRYTPELVGRLLLELTWLLVGCGLTRLFLDWPMVLAMLAAGLVVSAARYRRWRHLAREVVADADGLTVRLGRRTVFVPWATITRVTTDDDLHRVEHDGGEFAVVTSLSGEPADRLVGLCRNAARLRLTHREVSDSVPAGALSRLSGDEAAAARGLSLSGEEPR